MLLLRVVRTYHGGRLVIEDLLDLLQNIGSEFRNDVQCLDIINDLFGLARAQYDRRGAR